MRSIFNSSNNDDKVKVKNRLINWLRYEKCKKIFEDKIEEYAVTQNAKTMNLKEFDEKFEIQENLIDDSIKYEFVVYWKEKRTKVFTLNLDIPISILDDLIVLYGLDKDEFIENAKISAKNAIYANFHVKDKY